MDLFADQFTNPATRPPIPKPVAWLIFYGASMALAFLLLVFDGVGGVREFRKDGRKGRLAMCLVWVYLLFVCSVKFSSRG